MDSRKIESTEERDARMKWWREARFGLFIHWGVYAVPAGVYDSKEVPGIGEWIMNRAKIPVAVYREYAKDFNPVKYDPDAWVQLAKEAGMKYLVITSKHHDGFALFDSKVTEWDIMGATPYGKDLLKPLAEACQKHGIRLGFYYSQAQDWTHPGGAASGGHWDEAQDGSMDDYIRDIAVPQVKEILTNYGPIAVLWWDTPTDMNQERAEMLLPLLELQPGIIHNNRLGGGYEGDLSTPEQYIPDTGIPGRDWEVCMTMNGTWGFKSWDHNWKSTEVLLQNLVDIASKGGNYLLNAGPTKEGEIPQPSIDRLKEVGAWMQVNGESIYASQASPFRRPSWGRCTRKEADGKTTLYLHVFDWTVGELDVPVSNSALSCSLLADASRTFEVTQGEEGLTVQLTGDAPDSICSVVVLEIEGVPEVIIQYIGQADDGSVTLKAADASINNPGHRQAQYESGEGKDNIGYWMDPNSFVDWAFKLDSSGQFDVQIESAAIADGVCVQITAGDQDLCGLVPNTGDYGEYATITLSQITLDQTGNYTLAVHPVAKDWQPINLRSVTLKPVK